MADPSASTGAAPAAANPLIGRILAGRYQVESVIGQGGMGDVYLVRHTVMRKRLALKLLRPELSQVKEFAARFEREAMAAANIDHPHVAAATDCGKTEDGTLFLALEYVEGQSLRQALAEGPLPLTRALHIAHQVAGAMMRAHELGIIHRDACRKRKSCLHKGARSALRWRYSQLDLQCDRSSLRSPAPADRGKATCYYLLRGSNWRAVARPMTIRS